MTRARLTKHPDYDKDPVELITQPLSAKVEPIISDYIGSCSTTDTNDARAGANRALSARLGWIKRKKRGDEPNGPF